MGNRKNHKKNKGSNEKSKNSRRKLKVLESQSDGNTVLSEVQASEINRELKDQKLNEILRN